MEFGRLLKQPEKIFLCKNHAENEVGRLVQYIFLFFKKALYKVNARSQYLSFNTFW